MCRTRPRTVSPPTCLLSSGKSSPETSPSLRAQVPSCLSPAQPLPTSSLFSQPLLSSHDNNNDCSFHVSPLGGRYTRFTDEEIET